MVLLLTVREGRGGQDAFRAGEECGAGSERRLRRQGASRYRGVGSCGVRFARIVWFNLLVLCLLDPDDVDIDVYFDVCYRSAVCCLIRSGVHSVELGR